jgi:DNA-directed RNA polymerase III subunit RPC6
MDKCVKELLKRKLIKEEKSIAAKNKKVYLLYDLTPSKAIKGGVWWSGHDFDQGKWPLIIYHSNLFISII